MDQADDDKITSFEKPQIDKCNPWNVVNIFVRTKVNFHKIHLEASSRRQAKELGKKIELKQCK